MHATGWSAGGVLAQLGIWRGETLDIFKCLESRKRSGDNGNCERIFVDIPGAIPTSAGGNGTQGCTADVEF